MNLNQVTVPSLDVKKSVSFYQKLGLQLIVDSIPHYARFECPEGNSTFSIQHSERLVRGDSIHIYFELDKLDDKVLELTKNGVVFDELPNDKPWLWREARLKDPDGNHLILYYGGENRLNPPWKIDRKD